MDTESPQLRLSILAITAVSLFGALFARLWFLQVMSAPQFQDVAAANRERIIYEEAPRGRILDRNGRVLVDNRTSLVLAVDVRNKDLAKPEKKTELVTRVAKELTRVGIPTKARTLERRLDDKQYNPLTPIPLAVDIPEELQVYLAEHPEDFPGVVVRRESLRNYVNEKIASHVLGYVGRINEVELADKEGTSAEPKVNLKHYEPDSPIGKTGVEAVYEDELRGTPGVRRVEIDRFGRVVRTLSYTVPVAGNDVQLSLDSELQVLAEKTLALQLNQVRGEYASNAQIRHTPAGSVVVTDPRTGDVLAMASYPTFDPEEFATGISQERYDELTKGKASENPLVNRAISGLYAPGSTFKLVTAYGAMESGLIPPNFSYNDPGTYVISRCSLACDRKNAGTPPRAWGPVSIAKALTVSSDVFFYHLGDEFFWEKPTYGDGIQSAARSFGFGSKSGIDLPGEVAGVVPDAAYVRKLYDSMPPEDQKFGSPEFKLGDSVNLAIGQGYLLVTPLQLVDSYAAFANGGTLQRPRVATRILKPAGDPADPNAVVRTIEPTAASEFPLPAEIREPIRQGLRGVTKTNLDGTAGNAFTDFDQDAFPLISKTGTAQVDGKTDYALFVSCGPDPAARFCMSVVLEEAGFGGEVAAPIARRIYNHIVGAPADEWQPGAAVGNID